MVDQVASIADSLAAAGETRDALRGDRFFGVVSSVNADGTVTVIDGRGLRPSVRCVAAYSHRAKDDAVIVLVCDAGAVVLGKIGAPEAATEFVLDDAAAPGGAGWEETVTGQVWAKADGSVWMKRVTSAPPASVTPFTQAAGVLLTYRSGGQVATAKAEQGDYTGRGLCTGLATFGSWGVLSGKTAVSGVLEIHRRGGGHGYTYGGVAAYAKKCVASGAPVTPPTLNPDGHMVVAALNETQSVALPAAWCQDFCTGAADAIGFYSGNARDNIEIDSVTLSVSYT